jgi:hypothetical protein
MRCLGLVFVIAGAFFLAVVFAIVILILSETRSPGVNSALIQGTQTQSVEPKPTPSAYGDDAGPRPDAHDPATKIERVIAVLKGDRRYEFLKYDVWPGKYQHQKAWEINYYYNEQGPNGIPVLKHVISYFRQGKVIASTDPISVEEENERLKKETASKLGDGSWKDLSDGTEAEAELAAKEDARYAWYEFGVKPGKDGHFNWFEIGGNISDAEGVFHQRHSLVGGPVRQAYDKKFDEAFTAIAHRIEDGD